MRGKILRGMKKTGKNEGKKRISASFMTGAVALVFLVTGYQAALFLHKASVLRILSVRDHPDTVYVIDPALAESFQTVPQTVRQSLPEADPPVRERPAGY